MQSLKMPSNNSNSANNVDIIDYNSSKHHQYVNLPDGSGGDMPTTTAALLNRILDSNIGIFSNDNNSMQQQSHQSQINSSPSNATGGNLFSRMQMSNDNSGVGSGTKPSTIYLPRNAAQRLGSGLSTNQLTMSSGNSTSQCNTGLNECNNIQLSKPEYSSMLSVSNVLHQADSQFGGKNKLVSARPNLSFLLNQQETSNKSKMSMKRDLGMTLGQRMTAENSTGSSTNQHHRLMPSGRSSAAVSNNNGSGGLSNMIRNLLVPDVDSVLGDMQGELNKLKQQIEVKTEVVDAVKRLFNPNASQSTPCLVENNRQTPRTSMLGGVKNDEFMFDDMDNLLNQQQAAPSVEEQTARYKKENAVNNLKYKTSLCKHYERKQSCPLKEDCQFAHGPPELRDIQNHPLYKTRICRLHVEKNNCPYGDRCYYYHSEDERQAALMARELTAVNRKIQDCLPNNATSTASNQTAKDSAGIISTAPSAVDNDNSLGFKTSSPSSSSPSRLMLNSAVGNSKTTISKGENDA